MQVLFAFFFMVWIALCLVWAAMFTQPGRTFFAKRGYRFRRVRWTSAIAATIAFFLLGAIAQQLPPDKDAAAKPLEAGAAGAAPSAAHAPADEATSSTLGVASDAPPPDLAQPNRRALSDPEQQYANAVQSQALTLSESMVRFQGLATHPEIFNDDWKLNMAKELAIWQIMYGEAQKLSPSARFYSVQKCWVGALHDLNAAANEIASGIDHSDAEEINLATATISRSNGRISSCAQEISISMAE
jgi:hypothetical protein